MFLESIGSNEYWSNCMVIQQENLAWTEMHQAI